MGRPTKYVKEYDEQVYKLCLLGATDVQIADFFNIAPRTVDYWKHKYPDFLRSLKRGKIVADAKVAEALFNRAIGYEHPETKFFCYEGRVISVDTVKHYPPDTGAACMWLKNRAGWVDRKDRGHGGNLTVQDIIVQMGGTGDQDAHNRSRTR